MSGPFPQRLSPIWQNDTVKSLEEFFNSLSHSFDKYLLNSKEKSRKQDKNKLYPRVAHRLIREKPPKPHIQYHIFFKVTHS